MSKFSHDTSRFSSKTAQLKMGFIRFFVLFLSKHTTLYSCAAEKNLLGRLKQVKIISKLIDHCWLDRFGL